MYIKFLPSLNLHKHNLKGIVEYRKSVIYLSISNWSRLRFNTVLNIFETNMFPNTIIPSTRRVHRVLCSLQVVVALNYISQMNF